jgi:hypothetical protein
MVLQITERGISHALRRQKHISLTIGRDRPRLVMRAATAIEDPIADGRLCGVKGGNKGERTKEWFHDPERTG